MPAAAPPVRSMLSLTSTFEIAALAACAAAVAACEMASELDCAVDVTLPVPMCIWVLTMR